MRCATAVVVLFTILQQVSYIHANVLPFNYDELEHIWQKRLAAGAASEVSSAATKAAEAGVKVAKKPLHVSRTVAGAVTAAAATLGLAGGVAGHTYYHDKKQAQKLGLGNAPPMKRDNAEADSVVQFAKRGKPIPINKVLAIAGGTAAGGAAVGALGHSLYTKDRERRKEIAAVSAESGPQMMQKRGVSKGAATMIALGGIGVGGATGVYGYKAHLANKAAASAENPGIVKRSLSEPFEKRGKLMTGPQVAAIAGGSLAAGVATGVGIHTMVQDHNTIRQVRNGELPMKRSESEEQESALLKRGPTHSIFSAKAAGVIGAASFASGAAIGGLGHKAFSTPRQSMPMGMPQGSPPVVERDLEDGEQLVRRDKTAAIKNFFATKKGLQTAGGVISAGIAGTGLAVGHAWGKHSERKRIERNQAGNQPLGGGSEGAMMMAKRDGLIEALGHAESSMIERDFDDGQRFVRRENSAAFKAIGQHAKKFLATKHGPGIAGGVTGAVVAGGSLLAGHAYGHHSERKRIERFQAEQQQQQQGGGGEGAMMMVKRAGVTEALGHASTSLKGGMRALHGKVGKNGMIAIGTGAGATALAGLSYATGRHQGKISNTDDHQKSMGPSAAGGSSMMYKRSVTIKHPKTLAAVGLGTTALLFGQTGAYKAKLHEQRKLNGMDRHLSSSSSSSSMGLPGGGGETQMMKRAHDENKKQVPSMSDVEREVKKSKPRKSQKKEVHASPSHITPPTSPEVSNAGDSVSQHSVASSSHSSGTSGKVLEHQHSTASSKGLSDAVHHAQHASAGSAAVEAGEQAAKHSWKNLPTHVTGKQAAVVGGVLAAAGGTTLLVHHLTKSNNRNQKRNEVVVSDGYADNAIQKRNAFTDNVRLQKRTPGKSQFSKTMIAIGTGALAGGSYLAGYATGKPAGISEGARHDLKMRNSGGMGMGGGMYKRAFMEAEVELAKREAITVKAAQKAVMGVGAAGLVAGGFLLGRKHGKERGEADFNLQKLQRGGGGGYYKRRSLDESQMVKRSPMSVNKKVLVAAGIATIGAGLTVPAYKMGKKDGKYQARKARNASRQAMSAPMDNGPSAMDSNGLAPMQKRDTHHAKYTPAKPQQYGKGNKIPLRSEVDDMMLF